MSRTVCFLVLSLVLQLAARPAAAHALLTSPKPRDQQDGYKDPPMTPPGTGAPCGISEAASQPHNTLTAGAPLTVTWSETINHPGCFVIDFSAADDKNFQILGVKSHMNAPAPDPTKAKPRMWSLDVTLPTTPCPKCTLRLRQLMLNSDVTADKCPPASIPTGSTYYSCSNVALTAATTGAGGTGGAGTGSGGTGGSSARGGSGGRPGVAGTPGQGGSLGGPAGQTGATAGAAGTSVNPSGAAGSTVDPSGVAGSTSTGVAGSSSTGIAGSSSTGVAGSSTGVAGSSSTGAAGSTGNDDGGGGCATTAGTSPLALLLMAGLLSRRRSRRSRS